VESKTCLVNFDQKNLNYYAKLIDMRFILFSLKHITTNMKNNLTGELIFDCNITHLLENIIVVYLFVIATR